MFDIGTLSEISRTGEESANFEWRIEGWRGEEGRKRWSPYFSFAGTEWELFAEFGNREDDRIVFSLVRLYRASEGTVDCWLGIGTADGGEELLERFPGNEEEPSWTLSDLATHERRVAPNGTLTILVRMRTDPVEGFSRLSRKDPLVDPNRPAGGVVNESGKLPSVPSMDTDASSSGSYLNTAWNIANAFGLGARFRKQISPEAEEFQIVNPVAGNEKFTQTDFEDAQTDQHLETESDQISNSTTKREEHTVAESEDILVLQEHFRKLLLSADDHDVVLRVKTKEFRAHKSVLRARSPVFEAMFSHGMKESTENTVDIEDCDPDSFGQFLQYVYTGKVDDLSPSYALGLYYTGDKYGFPGLKRTCVGLLQSSLAAPLMSDVITLAVTHEEEELLESAMAYVTRHLEEVMETVEWQRFIASNPIRANEVCLKAVKRRRTSNFQ